MSEAAPRQTGRIRGLGLALVAGVALLEPCATAHAGIAAPQATNSASPAAPATQPQGVSAQPLAFDVVSIRPYPRNNMMISIRMTPDGVSVSGMPMHMVLREAFGMTNDRLFGGPSWSKTSLFDIEAKVSPDDAPKLKTLTMEQRWTMLLPALEERCNLKFHHETRELTVYMLVIAKGGLKMQPAQPVGNAAPSGPMGPGPGNAAPPAPPPPPGPGTC